MTRIAVAGAGFMARLRGKAFLETGQAIICGVAATHEETARACAEELGCDRWFSDYRRLRETRPDALLVEVPHHAQHAIVAWALEAGLPVLIGGSLAATAAEGEAIRDLAAAKGLVVEAGYQARYQDLWETARTLMHDGTIGDLVAVRSIALWGGDPASWYYNQQASGGMPLTHMTYGFINPVRFLLGTDPLLVSAFANRKAHTAPELIAEETVVANLLFPDDVPYTITAGFVKPGGVAGWSVTVLGTKGALELSPEDMEPGSMTAYFADGTEPMAFTRAGFIEQNRAFLAALAGADTCLNTPAATLPDILTAEAIVTSAREKRTVSL
jgi:myo-inositol 2-dehydrogenase/D-chiro-inositol 1-dehydrogenase